MTASIMIRSDGSVTVTNETVTRREFNYASMAALVAALEPVEPVPPPGPEPGPAITPEQFGAKGDGVADDLAALNAAIAKAKEVGKDLFCRPDAVYLISGPLVGLTDWHDFAWHGYGATIRAAKGVPSNSGGSLVTLTRCSGFGIYSLTVDGSSQERGNIENWSGHNFQTPRVRQLQPRRGPLDQRANGWLALGGHEPGRYRDLLHADLANARLCFDRTGDVVRSND